MKKVGVVILGGTGFGAGELLRLFVYHPNVEVVSVVSSSLAGSPISKAHKHLAGFYEGLKFSTEPDLIKLSEFEEKVLISSLPHGTSLVAIEKITENCSIKDLKIIDLSGDIRLIDPKVHSEFYKDTPLLPEIRGSSVYGLSELNKVKIKNAKIVSNPGCLATAANFAVMALSVVGVLPNIVLNLATGSSGSGKDPRPSTHHPLRHSNYYAYKVLSHQHEPEVVQVCKQLGFKELNLHFASHSLPLVRGILCTAYGELTKNELKEDIIKKIRGYFADNLFVRILDEQVEIQNIIGSNFVDISVEVRDTNICVTVAIDNLVKGMAGQAIQNMNIMCGLPEITGLWTPSLRPI